jgi:hypothetical protein
MGGATGIPSTCYTNAVMGGHLEVLQWLRANVVVMEMPRHVLLPAIWKSYSGRGGRTMVATGATTTTGPVWLFARDQRVLDRVNASR